MKFRFIPIVVIAVAAVFSSCSSVYQARQTPDDVYYSPAREAGAYVEVDQRRDGRYYASSYDDRWLRMRVRDRYRWSAFNDYDWNDWRYNSWSYSNYSPWAWNSYWNSYYRWNSWYNPYCSRIIVVNPKTQPQVYTKVRNFSLNSYTNTSYNNSNRQVNGKGIRLTPNYSNSNNNSSLGSSLRRVFSSGSGNNGSYNPSSSGSSSPTRTYQPSSSSSNSSSSGSRSSGGSSGGGSSPSRPSRGGN